MLPWFCQSEQTKSNLTCVDGAIKENSWDGISPKVVFKMSFIKHIAWTLLLIWILIKKNVVNAIYLQIFANNIFFLVGRLVCLLALQSVMVVLCNESRSCWGTEFFHKENTQGKKLIALPVPEIACTVLSKHCKL